jgi:hypothetical protein
LNQNSWTTKGGVPKWIFLVIIIIISVMFLYASYWDRPVAEETVDEFYHAYFDKDFETMAQNLSVFWSANFLPQYAYMDKDELLASRPEIEKATVEMFTSIEGEEPMPSNIDVKILKEYTKQGENSALVVYEIVEGKTVAGTEAALLIQEESGYKIFTMASVDRATLQQLKDVDISILDENFGHLLE